MTLNEDLTSYSQNHAENEARRLAPQIPLFVYLNAIYEIKAKRYA